MPAFEGLVGELEYPMFIVTACSEDGEPLGCLVGFTTQRASLRPASSHACRTRTARTAWAGTRPRSACTLSPPTRTISRGETGDETDKFARTSWQEGPEGVPILERCSNWFVGRVLARLDAGDHDAFLLAPIAGSSAPEDEFTFHRAKRIDPGHQT